VMTPTIPAELISLSGERRISELDDVDALVRVYKPKVFRLVAFSISDRDAAESITQDCLLKAHLTRNQFRGDCSVATWLMRIAFNLIRDHTKSQKAGGDCQKSRRPIVTPPKRPTGQDSHTHTLRRS